MITVFKWILMLSKRLYKKPSYIAILALIPLCVSALVFASERQGGFINVVLAQEDNQDVITNNMIDDFLSSTSLINFSEEVSPEAAIEAVKKGNADMAWIFSDDMDNRLMKFVENTSKINAIAKVVVRESNVFTRISQEKLTASLFKHCAKAQYFNQIRNEIPKLDKLSDETLEDYFDSVTISEELFEIKTLGGGKQETEINYMTAPLRGLMAVAICICAVSAAIFHLQDEKRGTFATVNERLRPSVSFSCILIAVFNISAVVLLTLTISGLDGGFFRECAHLLLYSLCATAFAFFLQQIFSVIQIYTAIIPLLAVAMVAACPIFAGVKSIQYFFPPTYFINAFYDNKALLSMSIYTVSLVFLSFVIIAVKKLKYIFIK